MFIIKLLSLLPLSILYLISDFFFIVNYYIVGYRREMVRKNLKNSFLEKSAEELRSIERKFYRNLGDMTIETFKALTISKKELARRMVFQGDNVTKILSSNKPVVLMTSHFSNWEWALLGLCDFFPMTTHAVYQQLHNKFFDKMMLYIRSRTGAVMHEKRVVMANLAKMGKKPFALALVSDQRPNSAEGRYWSKFMDQDAAFYSGSEIIAKRMDIPVLYLHIHRTRRGHYSCTFAVITEDPRLTTRNEITDRFIRLMERDIRQDPSSYLWSHNRWKHKRPIESN